MPGARELNRMAEAEERLVMYHFLSSGTELHTFGNKVAHFGGNYLCSKINIAKFAAFNNSRCPTVIVYGSPYIPT